MAKVILGMTLSLDGFINDRTGKVGALYPDLYVLRNTEPMRESIQNTGAVVMGRNAFAMAKDPDFYAGNYEFQVPIFVLTHEVPKKHPKETGRLTFTFVTDGMESAIRQTKAAAGDKDVVSHWRGKYRTAMLESRNLRMNCTLTSCPCSFAAVFVYLRISALNRFNWKD